MKEEDKFLGQNPRNDTKMKKYNIHVKAINTIICAIFPKKFQKISNYNTTKEMQDKPMITLNLDFIFPKYFINPLN